MGNRRVIEALELVETAAEPTSGRSRYRTRAYSYAALPRGAGGRAVPGPHQHGDRDHEPGLIGERKVPFADAELLQTARPRSENTTWG